MTRARTRGAVAMRPLVEVAVLISMLVVALYSGSLILWGETLRSTLATGKDLWRFRVIKKAATGSLPHYEFGLGKLEQAGNLALSLVMLGAGLILARTALQDMIAGEGGVSHFGLVLASLVLGANTLVCIFSLLQTHSTWRTTNRPGTRASLAAGSARLASLLFLQTLLVLAALSRSSDMALLMDNLGGFLVGLFLALTGLALLWEAVLDLIDHPMSRKAVEVVFEVLLQQGIGREEILDIRSRRAGPHPFIEITWDPREDQTLEILGQRIYAVKRALGAHFEGLDLTVRLQRPEQKPKGSDGVSKPAMPFEASRFG